MNNRLLDSLQLKAFLSFAPKSEPVALTNLNVLIGPNGVGKSNFVEALELLHATPADLSGVIRLGGTPNDWIWHGEEKGASARVEATLSPTTTTSQLKYAIEFTESFGRLEIADEVLEEADNVRSYYSFQQGHPAILVKEILDGKTASWRYAWRKLKRESVDPQQSILSQRKDPDLYPEVTATAKRFGAIQVFREWGFGRSSALRAA